MTLFWFRRDLRLHDNAGLYAALNENNNVQPIFIYDTNILEKIEQKDDARIQFIHQTITGINDQLKRYGSSIRIFYGKPVEIFTELLKNNKIKAVYTNHDYEPYARERDLKIKKLLKEFGTEFKSYKDQVIFEKNEVVKPDGKPYTVFTPYLRKWKSTLQEKDYTEYNPEENLRNLKKSDTVHIISLEELGFMPSKTNFPGKDIDINIIKNYHKTRDIPSVRGTTRISLHLRFGTVSIRRLVKLGIELNEKWLNELIWREFYMSNILWHFPQVINESFKRKYDRINWRNNPEEFDAWCQGNTGYPIVDAGMRELNTTGFMHNRLRMITASFLTKHLLTDWRWGEAYFAKKLLDYELSSNNGGWQWAASTGCDAVPYFRIFNPYSQQKKFDKEFKYIRKWVPEFEDPFNYPDPIVDHAFARQRALEEYKKVIS